MLCMFVSLWVVIIKSKKKLVFELSNLRGY